LLSMFKSATLALECFKTPTLHLVAYWRNRLLEYCGAVTDADEIMDHDGNVVETIPADSDDILAIKLLLRKQIESKWSLCKLHIMASLLDPRQKARVHLMGVQQSDIDEAKTELMRLTKAFATFTKSPYEQEKHYATSSPSTFSRPSRPLKRPKLAVRSSSQATSLASSSDEDDEEHDSVPHVDIEQKAAGELSNYIHLKLVRAVKDDLEIGPGRLLTW
jgi:hypothetical protein